MIKSLLPAGIMAGAVIGAGIFSLPYIFIKAGIFNSLLYLFLATAVVSLVHLFYADIVMRTKGIHNFVGYSRIYLGEIGGWLAILISVVQMVLVLTIYLILSQSFFNLVLGSHLFLGLIIFWALGSVTVFLTLKRLAVVESLIAAGLIAIITLVFVVSWPNLANVNFNSTPFSVGGFLLTIGPILFALGGRAAVVEAVRYAKRPVYIKRGIILGTVGPAIIYGLFAIAVTALSSNVSEDAVTGLINQVPPALLVLIGVLGLLSILSSYVAIGFDINHILRFDLRWKFIARFLAIAVAPLVIYLLGFRDFLGLVSFSGGVLGALAVIFIALMWYMAGIKKKLTGPILVKASPWTIIFIVLLFGYVLIQQVYVHIF